MTAFGTGRVETTQMLPRNDATIICPRTNTVIHKIFQAKTVPNEREKSMTGGTSNRIKQNAFEKTKAIVGVAVRVVWVWLGRG